MQIRNITRGVTLGDRVKRADRFQTRLLGLMFRRRLGVGEGLLIDPCKAIHTHFMRFPIDVLFLDAGGRVVLVIPAMRAWRQSPYVREARAVLEVPAGASFGTEPGDLLLLED